MIERFKMIFSRVVTLCASLAFLTGCSDFQSAFNGKRAKEIDRPAHDLFVTSFDVSSAMQLTGEKNPIGSLQVGSGSSIFFCTTFLASDGMFFTNAHCVDSIVNKTSPLSDARILMQNPDGSSDLISIAEIAHYTLGQKYGESEIDKVDWAALRVDDSAYLMEKYGSLSFHNSLPSIEQMQANLAVQAAVVNPPGSMRGTLLLKEKKGTADTATVYKAIIEILEKSETKTNNQEETVRNIFKIYPFVDIVDINIINGNSGSPVLFEGKVIGIVSHGNADNTLGLMQWIFNINTSLGYAQSLAGNDLLNAAGY